MTYPVDDAGNPRVDFVWGQFPLQPDDQRERTDQGGENITTDGNWTVTKERGSSFLNSGWTELSFGTGDGGNTRYQTFTWDNHEIATTGYSNYPAYEPNYAGDGDIDIETFVTMPNLVGLTTTAANALISGLGFPTNVQVVNTTWVGATTVNDGKIESQSPLAGVKTATDVYVNVQKYNAPEVPNVVGLTEVAATAALNAAHVVKGAVTTANNAAGATALNDGKIKTQTPAAGTTVNTGSSVALVKYAYVGVSTTGPISGFNRGTPFSPLGADQTPMYLVGRTVRPAIGDTITITGASDAQFNRDWYVENVIDNDGYNTGGTAVLLTKVGAAAFTGTTATGGTWTKQ